MCTQIKIHLFICLLTLTPFSQGETNAFLEWAQQYAKDINEDACWICGLLPISSTSGLPWWVSPLQGSDWIQLQALIKKQQNENTILRLATRSNVSQWPVNETLHQKGHGKNFSLNETLSQLWHYSEPNVLNNPNNSKMKNDNHRYLRGFFQIWDEHIWLTTTMGQLSQKAALCWEQRNHTLDYWSNSTRNLGWTPKENCNYTIILKDTDWFATNWKSKTGIRWPAPNGTQWLCGTNLWPWLPPGWIGRCTLGYPWVQGRRMKTIDHPANLPNLRHRWARSVFHWYDHLSSVFIPQVGIESVIAHMESFSKYTQKALNDTALSISLLNDEMKMMRKAVLQNRMALDILTAAQGGTCAIIKAECCVYIPDNSGNVSSVLDDLRSQINGMSDPAVSFSDVLASLFSGVPWLKKPLIYLGMMLCIGLLLCLVISCFIRLISNIPILFFQSKK